MIWLRLLVAVMMAPVIAVIGVVAGVGGAIVGSVRWVATGRFEKRKPVTIRFKATSTPSARWN